MFASGEKVAEFPELSPNHIEKLCTIAEEAARQHILSRVPAKFVEKLDVTVEVEGSGPLTLAVEVELTLSPIMQYIDVEKLAEEAVKEAFTSAENYLRELKCPMRK
ncbi:MAG: DUF3194 domain-containing protein [Candidatus Bathyarchaeia archaeon]